jgi:beta-glucosidase
MKIYLLTTTLVLSFFAAGAQKKTAQLYIRDMVGSVVRPVSELKGFQQVSLKAGESKQLSFNITADDLRFYNDQLQHIFEPGDFVIMVGGNSRDLLSAKVNLGR